MREKIIKALNVLYKAYPINTHKGKCKEPYYVVKFNDSNNSNYNSLGVLQKLEVMAYVPDTSIANIDKMLEEARTVLKDIVDFTGLSTPDYHDEDKEAYMKSYVFTFPLVKD